MEERCVFLPRSPLCSPGFSAARSERDAPWTRKIRDPAGAQQRGFARWRGFWCHKNDQNRAAATIGASTRAPETCLYRVALRRAPEKLIRNVQKNARAHTQQARELEVIHQLESAIFGHRDRYGALMVFVEKIIRRQVPIDAAIAPYAA